MRPDGYALKELGKREEPIKELHLSGTEGLLAK
jgi:hypothetical protein